MECKKCSTDIPSQFEYIIKQNICPKCGNKLMPDLAMQVYLDIKKRLNEVEFVMDKAIVCDRIAMFMVSNYEVAPVSKSEKEIVPITDKNTLAEMKAQLPPIEVEQNADDYDLTEEEIREQESRRADEISEAREMGIDIEDSDLMGGNLKDDRVNRLKRIAKTKPVVRRID